MALLVAIVVVAGMLDLYYYATGLFKLLALFRAATSCAASCAWGASIEEELLFCDIFMFIDFFIASRSIKDWFCRCFLGIEFLLSRWVCDEEPIVAP